MHECFCKISDAASSTETWNWRDPSNMIDTTRLPTMDIVFSDLVYFLEHFQTLTNVSSFLQLIKFSLVTVSIVLAIISSCVYNCSWQLSSIKKQLWNLNRIWLLIIPYYSYIYLDFTMTFYIWNSCYDAISVYNYAHIVTICDLSVHDIFFSSSKMMLSMSSYRLWLLYRLLKNSQLLEKGWISVIISMTQWMSKTRNL